METRNFEVSKYNASLSENQLNKFSELTKIPSPEAMKSKVKNDSSLTNLVKTHFKQRNESILNNYKLYWISVTTLQDKLVKEWYDLGKFWRKRNWVDGDFWTNTFVAIVQAQKALWLKPTWVANLDFLKLLFPRTFKSLNKKDGRSVNDTRKLVDERIKTYRDWLEEKRVSIKKDTKKEILDVAWTIVKDKSSPIDKNSLLSFYRKKYADRNPKITKESFIKYNTAAAKLERQWALKSAYLKNAKKISDLIINKWFPTYKWWPYCGLNVWELLLDAWFNSLPKGGRDWYKWTWFLEWNPNFVKEKIAHPNQAKEWWVLVYNNKSWPRYNYRWKENSRYKYWHVEIKVPGGFWWGKNHPSPRAWAWRLAWFTWYVYYPKTIW